MREDANEMSIDEAIKILTNPLDYIRCLPVIDNEVMLMAYELKVALNKAIDVMEETGTFYKMMKYHEKEHLSQK